MHKFIWFDTSARVMRTSMLGPLTLSPMDMNHCHIIDIRMTKCGHFFLDISRIEDPKYSSKGCYADPSTDCSILTNADLYLAMLITTFLKIVWFRATIKIYEIRQSPNTS